jgi:hypothetical protein
MPARLRRLAFGLATVTGLARRGLFVPYRHAGLLRPIDYAPLLPLLERALPAMLGHLEAIEAERAALLALAASGPARFDQGWFPTLDAAALYAMVARLRPMRVVEVGSGHSTRFVVAAARDKGLPTEVTCIDPEPRRALGGLGVRHLAAALESVPEEPWRALAPGDVLLIDSSHVLVPGSDVDIVLNRILPALPAGVVVHIHDIHLPDPYPASWAWRGYNEQQAVACLLQGGGFELLFASRYMASRHADRVGATVIAALPRHPGAPDGSLWLRKRRSVEE